MMYKAIIKPVIRELSTSHSFDSGGLELYVKCGAVLKKFQRYYLSLNTSMEAGYKEILKYMKGRSIYARRTREIEDYKLN